MDILKNNLFKDKVEKEIEKKSKKEEERKADYYIAPKLKDRLEKKIIGELEKTNHDYVMVLDGREGCFFKDTLIKTSKGNKTIEELYNTKDSFIVDSLNLETKQNETGKASVVKTGIKELFELETIDGRKVKCTKNHTFFVLKDNKIIELPLFKLKEGDELICN
jgi:intein/homing endonuclease